MFFKCPNNLFPLFEAKNTFRDVTHKKWSLSVYHIPESEHFPGYGIRKVINFQSMIWEKWALFAYHTPECEHFLRHDTYAESEHFPGHDARKVNQNSWISLRNVSKHQKYFRGLKLGPWSYQFMKRPELKKSPLTKGGF